MGAIGPQVGDVARGAVDLDLGRDRQLGPRRGGGVGTVGDQPAGDRVGIAAVVLGQLGVGVRARAGEGQPPRRLPGDVAFDADHPRLAGVADDGQRVRPQERELEVLPVLVEHRAVEPQAVLQPRGLPADLVIGQVVGLIRRQVAVAVDAAGPEAGGDRAVDQLALVQAVGGVDLVGRPVGLDRLVEVGAGPRPHRDRRKALGLAGLGAEIGAEAVEALERVLGIVGPHSGRHGQPGRQVVGGLAEDGVVLVLALLLGQPQGLGPAGHPEVGAEGVDLVALLDEVGLLLVEQPGHEAQPVLLGRGDAQFVALLGEVVLGVDVLRRIDRPAGVVGDVGPRAEQSVVEERVVGVVRLGLHPPVHVGAGVD